MHTSGPPEAESTRLPPEVTIQQGGHAAVAAADLPAVLRPVWFDIAKMAACCSEDLQLGFGWLVMFSSHQPAGLLLKVLVADRKLADEGQGSERTRVFELIDTMIRVRILEWRKDRKCRWLVKGLEAGANRGRLDGLRMLVASGDLPARHAREAVAMWRKTGDLYCSEEGLAAFELSL